MKTFTTAEIRDLYNRFFREEISFSRMVEIMNERVSEEEKPNFKEGDFLHSDWDNENITIILKNRVGDHIYYHASKSCYFGVAVSDDRYWRDEGDFRHATEEEKQELLDALAKKGKRWNAEKLCVEDIPKHKFNVGDKVRIKHGVSSKTHLHISPKFATGMDDLIGKELTVDVCANGIVHIEESGYKFHEDWLEPYVEELKKGDLAIFWQFDKTQAVVRLFDNEQGDVFQTPIYVDNTGHWWANAVKFESVEQYERLLKWEI